MSDNNNKRGKKFNKSKVQSQEAKRPVILAKRENSSQKEKCSKSVTDEPLVQPKILLKSKDKEQNSIVSVQQSATATTESSSSQNLSTIVQINKEKEQPCQSLTIEQPIMHVPVMTRPIQLISSSNGQLNTGVSKVLLKSNTDFLVVGVIGCQGVGKSTILNLLTTLNDPDDIDFHKTLLKEKQGIFPTKFKSGKGSSLPHTDSIQMFITKDRLILLDCPPVLCNSYKRDATTNEIEDIKMIILLLTVCHLLIIVEDDFFSINLLRLVQFAELAKPNQDSKLFTENYLPYVLFVKNKAKRDEFTIENRTEMKQMLGHFFKDSQLRISLLENERNRKTEENNGHEISENDLNYFAFPEILDGDFTAYHPNLQILITEFRNRVFMTPRLQMYSGSTELTEAIWLEMVTMTSLNKGHFFLTTYEEIRRSHTHSGGNEQQSNKSINDRNFIDD